MEDLQTGRLAGKETLNEIQYTTGSIYHSTVQEGWGESGEWVERKLKPENKHRF